MGREETQHIRLLANYFTFVIAPTRTSLDLLRLIFNLETTSKHKNAFKITKSKHVCFVKVVCFTGEKEIGNHSNDHLTPLLPTSYSKPP